LDAPRQRDLPFALATACLAFAMALPFAWVTQVYPDEFTYASHGWRICNGAVIYRDFFEFVAPLGSWLAALVFTLTGPSIMALRVVTALALGATAGLFYTVARQLGASRFAAMLPGPIVVGLLYPLWPGFSHHWIQWPLVAAALLGATLGSSGERIASRTWLATGVCAGLAGLALQSDGLALSVALATGVVLDGWVGRRGWRVPLLRLAALGAGALLPVLLVIGVFALQGALRAATDNVWRWPLAHYRVAGGINDVRFLTELQGYANTNSPHFRLGHWYLTLAQALALWLLSPLLGLLVMARGLGAVAQRLRGGSAWSEATARLAILALVVLALFAATLRGRADFMHVCWQLPATLLLATVLAERWRLRFPEPGLGPVRWLPTLALAALLPLGAVNHAERLRLDPDKRPAAGGPDAAFKSQPALAYLRDHARPGDKVVALPHGGVFYLFGLPPASRWTLMYPPAEGYTTAAEFAGFWQEVTAANPRFVVTTPFAEQYGPVAMPLSGYKLVATLPFAPHMRAWIYERD
jgi:hypothetical protein